MSRVVGALQRRPVVQRPLQNGTCPDATVMDRALEELGAAVGPWAGAEPALLLLWARRRVKLEV